MAMAMAGFTHGADARTRLLNFVMVSEERSPLEGGASLSLNLRLRFCGTGSVRAERGRFHSFLFKRVKRLESTSRGLGTAVIWLLLHDSGLLLSKVPLNILISENGRVSGG